MLKVFSFVFLFLIAGVTFAQEKERYLQGHLVEGPYKTTIIRNAQLSFLETGDAEFPVSLVLDVVSADGKKTRELVDKYDVAGSAPRIESIFFYPVKGRRNILVLVSWEITSRGLGTYGTLYQVYGYERVGDNKLAPNDVIRFDKGLTGMDGYQEGEERVFAYKDAASIKAYIKQNINAQ